MLLLSGFFACATGEYARLYHTEAVAPSLTAEAVAALEVLGPTVTDRGVNFSVYAGAADRVDLLLFDDADDDRPTQRFPLERFGDVWNLYVEGVGLGQLYGFAAWGSNWPHVDTWVCGQHDGFVADVDARGNRFNPNKLLTDPWSRALTRDHDWGRGSAGSGESQRDDCTWGAAAKSIVMRSDYQWSDHEAAWRTARAEGTLAGHDWTDLVLYEVHPKGFTANGVDGVMHPGTFRGVGERAAWLGEMGFTGVEFLPIHEKPADGGYWGYNNINFFAPELTFSADYVYGRDPAAVVDEFKWMVDQLHQAGVEVILDVVYNHTGEGGLWRDRIYSDSVLGAGDAYNLDSTEAATIYNLRGLDNNAFYALSTDREGYWNNTGVGNQTRPNHTPTRRLILDSLHYMVEELHVDGFRFDLAGILGEKDGDYNNWDDPANTVLQDIADDPILLAYGTRLIAEPWTAGGNYTSIGGFPASTVDPEVGWGEWNASFRDWWRSINNDDDWALNSSENGIDGGGTLTGSEARYGANGRRPYHAVNFVTSHDGFTMYDLLSYNEKSNFCGPLNPTCCTAPASPWCDTESGEDNNRSRDWGQGEEPLKRQIMRNFFVAMLVSEGTPMLLGGDEWLRTQYGNNNAYSTAADNEWNWFRWGEWQRHDERWRMADFVARLVRYRLDHTYAFSPADYDARMPIAWRSPSGGDPDWGSRSLRVEWADDGTPNQAWSGKPGIVMLLNMERGDVSFSLPSGTWARVLDTQQYYDGDDWLASEGLDLRTSANFDGGGTQVSGSYTVPGTAIVLLEEVP
jgi:glycogen operon protein